MVSCELTLVVKKKLYTIIEVRFSLQENNQKKLSSNSVAVMFFSGKSTELAVDATAPVIAAMAALKLARPDQATAPATAQASASPDCIAQTGIAFSKKGYVSVTFF